jgi:hypothetical protein
VSTYTRDRDIDRAWATHQPERIRVPAEIWRKLRTFKRSIAPAAVNIKRILDDDTTMKRLMTNFAFKKGIGRARALSRLKKHLAGATLQAEDDTIIGTWLEPTGPILDSDDPSLQQDCIVVWVGFGGRQSSYAAGFLRLLSVEVPDHALARLLQRSPSADLAAALHEACVGYLSADQGEVLACIQAGREFYLPGGDGVFLCTGITDPSDGRVYTHARCRTWISDVMARPDQKPLPVAGDDGDPMLTVLLAKMMVTTPG